MAQFREISLRLAFFMLRKKAKFNLLIYKCYFNGSNQYLNMSRITIMRYISLNWTKKTYYYSLFTYTSKWYSRGLTRFDVLYLVPKLPPKYEGGGKKKLALDERQHPAVFNFIGFIFHHLSICRFN